MIQQSVQTLEQLKLVLTQLPKGVYSQPCEVLSGSSIGQHTRHVIELFQCLLKSYETAQLCYDDRERNKAIETDVDTAMAAISDIQHCLDKPNKPITIKQEFSGDEMTVSSNYHREVMYNLEHTIHHKALIKVGIQSFCDLALPKGFGVAPSTIAFEKACAQ